MCLYTTVDYEKVLEKYKKRGKKTIRGYKVLIRYNNQKLLRSVLRDREWRANKTGIYRSSRKSTKLTHKEETPRSALYSNGKPLLEIHQGFHFYRTREIARRNKDYHWNVIPCIVAFEVEVDDIVAFSWNEDQFVATKCKWIGPVR